MYRFEPPAVLPPESISENWVSKYNFDLNENLSFSFKIISENIDKELGFSVFLVNDESTLVFGASTARCGLFDYSTKGEVGEGVEKNGSKLQFDINEQKYDFLLDHFYPEDINGLVKNQNAFNTEGFNNKNLISILFVNNKDILKPTAESSTYYKNRYFDELTGLKDVETNELCNIDDYDNPILIQAGNNIFLAEFKIDEKLSIDNLKDYIIKVSIENKGGILKLDVLKPYSKNYQNLIMKEIGLDLSNLNNIKLGYGIATPLVSYDIEKIADFKIIDFHIQGKLK